MSAKLGVGVAAAMLLGAAAAAASGCNGASPPAPAQPEAAALCPETVEATLGARCGVAGLRCGPQYACGFLDVSLLCVCTEGTFHCADSMGNEVDAPPTCPDAAPTQACPRSPAARATCKEQGLLCAYPSACPGRFDQCQCAAGTLADGGLGLRFDCQIASCPVSDGASISFDSGADAPADGPTPDGDASPLADSSEDTAWPADAPGETGSADEGSAGDAPLD